ncbi:2-succinyl-5-enolpyruvyl-6-hydroxy-3-cyclohexene-1-carboxylic-acid synthase [soil metagenome]
MAGEPGWGIVGQSATFGGMNARNRNELWARALLDELARSGVRNIVVAPGSRSTPLVLAAAADPRFRTAVQVDERSAGFLALGVGKGTGVPAAVITTSGTAVANLLPAVVEAFQAEVPLLLLTADRPPRLRGADANQAIEQPHIFGRYTRLFQELAPTEVSDRALRHLRATASRAVAAAVGDPAGPVHLNLAFEKPLEPVAVPGDFPEGPAGFADSFPLAVDGRADGAPFTRIHPRRLLPADAVLEALAARLAAARRPLIVAGPAAHPFESGPPVRALARALSAPLLADPLSGARGREPGCGYDLALRIPEAREQLAPDLVLRFGTTPSSASLAACLAELGQAPGVPQVIVDGGDRWKDHLAVASEVVPGDPARVAAWLLARVSGGGAAGGAGGDATEAGAGWAGRWAQVDGIVAEAVSAGLGLDFFEGAAAVMAADHAAAEPSGILFVSNSMPVRDVGSLWPLGSPGGEGVTAVTPADAMALPPALRILGNRGASGIDGIVSTALGVAWGTGERVTALIGDLALVHDMNGLLRARDLDHCGVDFVVVNNDGGGIFHLLAVRDYEPHFTRFVATPHGLEPERIAALHSLPFRRIEGRSEHAGAAAPLDALRDGLSWARDQPGSTLLEIRTDRNENRARHDEVLERIRAALVAHFSSNRETPSEIS